MATHEITTKEKQEAQAQERTRPGRTFVPDVDIREDNDALWLWADMPGVAPDAVEVELHDDVLQLEGRVSLDAYEGLTPAYTEYNVGDFARRFTLPDAHRYDAEKVSARLANGVLQVKLPKTELAKPRRIPINAS
jgi:HSP20 family molecular chaperone IbpA